MAKRYGEIQWLPRVQKALGEDRLRLFIQPIIALGRSGSESEYGEVLLRLLDERGELILPDAFLPSAERYNQMVAIDRWVIRRCLETLRHQPQTGKKENSLYAVNLSGQTLANESLLDFMLDQFKQTHVRPSAICFEISENATSGDRIHAMHTIVALKELGCYFALDDFGSGLASLTYLKSIPADYLKIDGHLVKDIAGDPVDRTMVEAVYRIGKVMGLQTVAEWVEDAPTRRELEAIGVDYAQGFLFAERRLLA